MGEWTEMFKSDPDLGVMEQAYQRLRSQNPNLQPPSKPHKREITDLDRQKEEEELQMALAISLRENRSALPGSATAGSSSGSQQAQKAAETTTTAQTSTPPVEEKPHTTAATVSRVRALYDFEPSEAGELAFKKGDVIAVLESVYKDWWKGSLNGQVGIFPLNYVEKLPEPTVEDLRREALMEAEVFAEVKNVEKLLALLSQPDAAVQQNNDEITVWTCLLRNH
jgi:signal transducing adaptor molecule